MPKADASRTFRRAGEDVLFLCVLVVFDILLHRL